MKSMNIKETACQIFERRRKERTENFLFYLFVCLFAKALVKIFSSLGQLNPILQAKIDLVPQHIHNWNDQWKKEAALAYFVQLYVRFCHDFLCILPDQYPSFPCCNYIILTAVYMYFQLQCSFYILLLYFQMHTRYLW